MHKNLVSLPGEWYVDNDQIYYMPKGDIEDTTIEMQVRKEVLKINNVQNVVLENLKFISGNGVINSSKNITINNCTMQYLSPFINAKGYSLGSNMHTGFCVNNCSGVEFINSYVAHTWGTGISVVGGKHCSFKNCIIEDIGWVGTFTSSIYSSADNTLVEDCSFKDNGRFQICVDTDIKIDILHNSFRGAMQLGEDAGPLEFTSTQRVTPLDLKESVIAYNKIFDVHGIPAFEGHYQKQFIVAFYMEETNNYTAHHNLIYDITANSYNGPENFVRAGQLMYLGPKFKHLDNPINFYNNTAFNYEGNIAILNVCLIP